MKTEIVTNEMLVIRARRLFEFAVENNLPFVLAVGYPEEAKSLFCAGNVGKNEAIRRLAKELSSIVRVLIKAYRVTGPA